MFIAHAGPMPHRLLIITLLLPIIANAYQWPSPQYDALEEMLYEGRDKFSGFISSLANSCSSRLAAFGPPISAEWLRLAYHDMATHNVTDGTGGLDGSIYYEYQRPENIGAGIIDSLNDFRESANKYVSRADVIAMGAIWGVTACGGPPIAFKGGRIDALKGGRFGVPEPQQDLDAHTESFRLQGFTPTEMISLVACGHTFGAVRNLDFPDIVPGPKNDTLVASFDTTVKFDSVIVSEYLNGTTQNPLVVNANTTIQSDRRIFASDNNVTMKSIESPAAFSQTCSTLFARMLDTVPSAVNLTDEITFLPFKLKSARITVADSRLVFFVRVRIQVPTGATRNATLLWCDRYGSASNCSDGQANFATSQDLEPPNTVSPLTVALGINTVTFDFTVPLKSGSVQKFWFEVVDEHGAVTVEDNGGIGYMIEQDTLIALSSTTRAANSNGLQQTLSLGIMAGIRNESAPTLVQVRLRDNSVRTQIQATTAPSIPEPTDTTIDLVRNNSMPSVGGYIFYTGRIVAQQSATLDFAAEVNGTRYEVDFESAVSSSFDNFGVSTVGKRALRASNTTSSGAPQETKPSSALRNLNVVMGQAEVAAFVVMGVGIIVSKL